MSWNVAGYMRAGLCTVALVAATSGSVAAQGVPPDAGIVVGIVANCVNDVEQPVQGATVNAVGSSLSAVTDQNGQFALGLAPGTYTINVASAAGNGSRPNVPVDGGALLDVGTTDVGAAAITGCGPEDTPVPQTAAPTVTPTAAPTVAPTATAVPPTPVPTATSVPSTDQPAPDMTSPDQSVPSDTQPGDNQPDPNSQT